MFVFCLTLDGVEGVFFGKRETLAQLHSILLIQHHSWYVQLGHGAVWKSDQARLGWD